MLKCLIAFVLGFMVARMNGVVEGSEKPTATPTISPDPWGKLGKIVGDAASGVSNCPLPGGIGGWFSHNHNNAVNRDMGTWYDYSNCEKITEKEYEDRHGSAPKRTFWTG